MRNRLQAAESRRAPVPSRPGRAARRPIKSPRRVRTIPLAMLFVGIAPVILAACGSSSASGANASSTKPSGTASRAAYSACLKQHGVTLPIFTGGAGGPPPGGGTPPSFTPGPGLAGFATIPPSRRRLRRARACGPPADLADLVGRGVQQLGVRRVPQLLVAARRHLAHRWLSPGRRLDPAEHDQSVEPRSAGRLAGLRRLATVGILLHHHNHRVRTSILGRHEICGHLDTKGQDSR